MYINICGWQETLETINTPEIILLKLSQSYLLIAFASETLPTKNTPNTILMKLVRSYVLIAFATILRVPSSFMYQTVVILLFLFQGT